ncbi:MAG: hypothetical protein B7Z08_11940 [Sphingomonadales bacterium 32-68-7]|nr:MAG: hypothetical protein B7Z33_04675 [Sphingomonadales bacterium 12-68-11]OYX07658.1 MAG: hypothetical protein B7Z08_11940 [Sphingomonadales bacterium 32-68-7]
MDNEQIKATILEYVQGSDHPDLDVYRRDVKPELLDLWLRRLDQYGALGGFQGQHILEAGCGFGWDAVGLSLKFDAKVTATDILPSMIDGVTQCLAAMAAKGKPLNVEARQADICTLDLPDNSLGGIFSSEAVEHVHSLEAMYANCLRMLKPGARLLIVNDSNCYNPEMRDRNREMWVERDESFEHAQWLKEEVRPVEHANAKPYQAMREDIIREAAPELSSEQVTKIARATAGLVRPEIVAAVAAYQRDGSVPVRPENSWCRNPETGEYAERLLDPFEMRDGLRAAGFRTQLRHLFTKMPHRLLNGIAIRPINEKLFGMRPQFVLVAEKPA